MSSFDRVQVKVSTTIYTRDDMYNMTCGNLYSIMLANNNNINNMLPNFSNKKMDLIRVIFCFYSYTPTSSLLNFYQFCNKNGISKTKLSEWINSISYGQNDVIVISKRDLRNMFKFYQCKIKYKNKNPYKILTLMECKQIYTQLAFNRSKWKHVIDLYPDITNEELLCIHFNNLLVYSGVIKADDLKEFGLKQEIMKIFEGYKNYLK